MEPSLEELNFYKNGDSKRLAEQLNKERGGRLQAS